ncbi:riboflavin synthase domain-like protein [Martensiomyces pterosporus]|nr:riboflavin synthase domain-like protein [Martensiomyces pterosporus]
MPDATTFVDTRVAFLYASQTGNAESISYNLYEEAVKRGYQASWHVLDDYEKFGFNDLRTVVFVVSTTGDGDPPDNSAKFWRVLRKATRGNPSAYSHLRYTVLGLGDTNYSNFCNTAQRLDKQLQAAGATAFYPKGLADDGTGLEEVVEPWIDGLWPALSTVAARNSAGSPASGEKEESSGEAADAVNVAAAIAELAIDGPPTDEPPAAQAHVHQPLLLDFRPLATLKSITGAPRVPSTVCSMSPLDADGAKAGAIATTAGDDSDASLAPFPATVLSSTCLTAPEALKRTLLLELDLSDTLAKSVQGSWQAGDAFSIYAPNSQALVSALLARLAVSDEEARRPVLLKQKDEKIALPAHLQRFTSTPASVHDILLWAVDVCSAPRKPVVRALADCCTDSADRDRLLYLSSRQGLKLFEELRRQAPTTLDILHAFPSCTPPVSRLLELLPPLAPRSYSICNAPEVDASKWRIAFNVVEYELDVLRRRGVCTPWLDSLSIAPEPRRVLVAKRPNISGFHLPSASTGPDPRPVIMVGPGTGVAPFIGFLEQRAKELESAGIAPSDGPLTWLFFGCRSSAHDYLFKSQLEQWHKDGILSRLSVCFSRDGAAREKLGAEKYVQDDMVRHEQEIADLLVNKDALLFVCGDAKGMGKDVNETLADIICRYAADKPELVQALQVLMRWSAEKRYLRDLWA